MRKLSLAIALALATMVVTAGAAFAYTLNADGTGFVGKGEVQTALAGTTSRCRPTLMLLTSMS